MRYVNAAGMLFARSAWLWYTLRYTGYRGVPMRVVDVDEGFAGNDQLKTNVVQTMKAKGATSFKTV